MRVEVVAIKDLVRVPYRKQLMRAYKDVFEGPPWNEKWPLPKVEEKFRSLEAMDAFCAAIVDDSRATDACCAGLMIYYFKKIADPIERSGLYIADYGIIPNMQRQGLGTLMTSQILLHLKNNSLPEVFFFRTMNPAILRILRKLGSLECLGRAKDDNYRTRLWYSFSPAPIHKQQ